jgi:hypothetical protein
MDLSDRSFARDAAFFVALLATSFALAGALAHAFELANKIGLSREEYFIAQKIYSGWDRLAYVLAIQLVGILATIILYRRQPRVVVPAVVALASLVTAQVVFWTWTFPANRATGFWTQQLANWEVLRAQWEYSHLAGAALQTIVMVALITAVLRRP